MRFSRWQKTGVLDRLLMMVTTDIDLEEVLLDSTAIRAHLHAARAEKTALNSWVDLVAAGAARSA